MIFFGGFTINLMTLGGLALGVGMMVDSSVVVLENIFRRCQEHKESAVIASTTGAEEVGTAILASTLTTLVIFVPLAFVAGRVRTAFQGIGFTVMFSLTCSLLVSLSLVPMLASKMLKVQTVNGIKIAAKAGMLFNLTGNVSQELSDGYAAFAPPLIAAPLAGNFYLTRLCLQQVCCCFPLIGSDFLPPSDEGEVRVTGEMEVGTRIDLVDRQTRLMEEIVLPAVPETLSSVTQVSAGGRNARSTGEIRISLTPATERTRSNTEIAADIRELLEGQIPGMTIRTRAPQGQFILERILGGDQGITVEIRGFDLQILDKLAEQAGRAIETVAGITDVDISRNAGVPQQDITYRSRQGGGPRINTTRCHQDPGKRYGRRQSR